MSKRNEAALSYEWSLALALSTGALANSCYANAAEALNALADWPDASLVEGWIVLEQALQVTIIEHCWCERGDLLLDPSIVLLLPQRLSQAVRYFPGVWRGQEEMHTLACRDLPFVRSCGRYGLDGLGHPAYRAAYEAAHAQAKQVASASLPPKSLVVQPSAFPAREEERHALVVQIVSSRDFWTTRARK